MFINIQTRKHINRTIVYKHTNRTIVIYKHTKAERYTYKHTNRTL